MIATSARSSLLNSWYFCENKCFLEYNLNIESPANSAADLGNVFHKAAELLNKKQLAIQNNQDEFTEGNNGYKFKTKAVNPKDAVLWAFDYYKTQTGDLHKWGKKELASVHTWMDYLLQSAYNPSKLNIFSAERFFDMEIKEDWAKYDFTVQGKKLEGYLRVRGTFDALILHGEDSIEYLDYKTGRPFYDWSKKLTKDVDMLHDDNQLLLYYYSLRKLYPQFKHHAMTLLYLKEGGGPLPCCFGDEEYERAEELIQKTFKNIVATKLPSWIYYNEDLNSNCGFCQFNKMTHKDSGKTLCKHYRDEVIKLGMDKVLDKYVDLNKLGQYTGGGTERRVE